MTPEVRILGEIEEAMKPKYRYANGDVAYSFSTSFPSRNVEVLPTVFPTPLAAYEAGREHIRSYERRNPYGNMGEVIGVVHTQRTDKTPDGYRAVVNTYHSNT